MERFVQNLRKTLESQIKETGALRIPLVTALNSELSIINVYTLFIESVMFCDLYKKINYKKVTSTLTDEDLRLIPIVDSITKIEHVHEALKTNPGFIEHLIKATTNFYNATIIEKISQLKALKQEDKHFLLEQFPPFQEDLDFYDKKVNIEILYLYYKNIEKFYKVQGYPFMKDSIIDQMVGFIKSLYHYDEENFIYITLKLALLDYKYTQELLKEENYPKIADGRKKSLYRLNLFEEGSMKEMMNYAILDDYYLFELIDTYLYTRDKHETEESYKEETNNIKTEKVLEKVKTIEERIKFSEN